MKKLKIILYFCFIFLSALGEREIPHEIIRENPQKPVKEIKALKRRKEDARIKLKVKKVKTTELPMEIDEVRRLIFFSLENNISEDKVIFLGEEELSWINNGSFRRKYVNNLRNKWDNNFKILNWKEERGKKKISYENLGPKLYVAILDENYNLKKVYQGKFLKKDVKSQVRSKIKVWLFGKDLDRVTNLIIREDNNSNGNFIIRANSEDSAPEYGREKSDTYSTFDMVGRFLNYDFDDGDIIRVEGEKNTKVLENNKGSFYLNRNKYSKISIPGYEAKVRVWSEYEGIELSLEKINKSDGLSKFKVIHETRDGKILQEIEFELYINNREIDDYFKIRKNARQIYYEYANFNTDMEIPTDIVIYNFITDNIAMEQLEMYTVEQRFGENGKIYELYSNRPMNYSGSGSTNGDSEGRVNYYIQRISLYISDKWYIDTSKTAQFFTGYGLNVTYGRGKRRVNIPARMGIFSNWEESTEKIRGNLVGLPLIGKALNKDNINGIQSVKFTSSHFEYIMVQQNPGIKILGNEREIYSSDYLSDRSKFRFDGIEYGLKYEYDSSGYRMYSMHIKKMRLENRNREHRLKSVNRVGYNKVVSKENIIYIPQFNPEVLINKYNSSLEKFIIKQEEVSPELLNHNMGKIISLGKVYFYQMNTDILRQNSTENPKVYLGREFQLVTRDRVPNKKIAVDLSFDRNGKKDTIEMNISRDMSMGEGGEVFLKISPVEYEKIIKNGGNVTYELMEKNNEICEVYFKGNRDPLGETNNWREFKSSLIERVIIKTKEIEPSMGKIEFLSGQPLLKGGVMAIKNGNISYVDSPRDYDYNRTVVFNGNIRAYDYGQKKHNVEIIDGDGGVIRKIVGSNGSGGYWKNIPVGNGNLVDIGYGKNDERTFISLNRWNFEETEGSLIIKHYVGARESIYQYYIFQFQFPKFDPIIYYDENRSSNTLKVNGNLEVQWEKGENKGNKNEIYLGEINLKNYNFEITKISQGDLKDEIGLRIEGNNKLVIKDESGRNYNGKIIIKDYQGNEINYFNDRKDIGKVYLSFVNSGNGNYTVDLNENEYILRIGRNKYFKNILEKITIKNDRELEGESTLEILGDYVAGTRIRFNSTTLDKKDIKSSLIINPRGINLSKISGSAPLKMEMNDRIKISLEDRIIFQGVIGNKGNLEERELVSENGSLYFSVIEGNMEIRFKKNQEFIRKNVELEIEVERNNIEVMEYELNIVSEPSWIIIDGKENIDFGKVLSGQGNIKGRGFISFRTSPNIDKNTLKVTLDNYNPILFKGDKKLQSTIEEVHLNEEGKNKFLLNILGKLDVPSETIPGDYVGAVEVTIEVRD